VSGQERAERNPLSSMRQSMVTQVAENTESQQRQYALVEAARVRIRVRTDDRRRPGALGLGTDGKSRLPEARGPRLRWLHLRGLLHRRFAARAQRDWHHLIDLCALVGAGVVDGAYDPRLVSRLDEGAAWLARQPLRRSARYLRPMRGLECRPDYSFSDGGRLVGSSGSRRYFKLDVGAGLTGIRRSSPIIDSSASPPSTKATYDRALNTRVRGVTTPTSSRDQFRERHDGRLHRAHGHRIGDGLRDALLRERVQRLHLQPGVVVPCPIEHGYAERQVVAREGP
jgi:hypothetical protein